MMRVGVVLAALQLMLAHAGQPNIDGARIAARMQSQLQSASRSLRERMSLEKPHFSAGLPERRLQDANGTTPCAVSGGTCMIADTWMTDLVSNLDANSASRTFFEQWRVCSVKAQADCNTVDCQWDFEENECSPATAVDVNAMDWFNFQGCGILESADAAARCGSLTNCASMANCAVSTTPTFEVGTDGMCASATKCEYSGDMFAATCGANFNIETSMSSCATSGLTNMDAMVQALITCISDACPSQSDFFTRFLTDMFACQAHDQTTCASTSGCEWDTTGTEPECTVQMNTVMAATIPETCAIRDFFLTSMDCEARPAGNGCASTNCHLATSLTCAAAGGSPTSMQQCQPKNSVIFAELAAGTCDNAEAQFYTRGILMEEACHAATVSACTAVPEVTSPCPNTGAGTPASHAMGVMPSLVPALAGVLAFLKLY